MHSSWWDGTGARVSGRCHPNPEILNFSLENQIIEEVKYREMSVILARKPEGAPESHHMASASMSPSPLSYRQGN